MCTCIWLQWKAYKWKNNNKGRNGMMCSIWHIFFSLWQIFRTQFSNKDMMKVEVPIACCLVFFVCLFFLNIHCDLNSPPPASSGLCTMDNGTVSCVSVTLALVTHCQWSVSNKQTEGWSESMCMFCYPTVHSLKNGSSDISPVDVMWPDMSRSVDVWRDHLNVIYTQQNMMWPDSSRSIGVWGDHLNVIYI